jgi:ABC-type glycerol-3-phosphate transport system substrate-binding protein
MKRIALFSLIFDCVVSLVFAGGGAQQAGGNGAASIKVQLKVFASTAPAEIPKGLEFFKQQNPDIGIEFEAVPNTQLLAKYSALLAANALPDVMNTTSGSYFSMVQGGVFNDLTEALKGQNYEGDAVWQDTFIPELLNSARSLVRGLGPEISSRFWGVPYMMTSVAVVYDKNMFDANGLKEPSNWDEFAALNEKLKSLGKVPFSMTVDLIDWYPRFFWDQRLRPILDKNPAAFEDGTLTFNSPEVKQGLADFKDMWDRGWLPAHGITASRDVMAQSFIQGQIAQYCIVPNGLRYLFDNVPKTWSLASYPFPSITGQPPRSLGGSSTMYSVPKMSKNPEAAIRVIKFLTSKTHISQDYAGLLNSGLVNVQTAPQYMQLMSGYLRAAKNGFIPDIYVPINASPELVEIARSDLLPNYLQGTYTLDYICNELQRVYKESYLDIIKK